MKNQEVENAEPGELIIAVGILDWRVVEKPAPVYPELVKKARLSGRTVVEVLIDKTGKVERAVVISGHPVLHRAVWKAAMQAKFYPTLVAGKQVKVSGFLSYDLG